MDADGSEVIVGLRTNDPGVVDALRARLQPWLIDAEAAPNISITAGEHRRGRRDTHRVHRRGVHTYRSFELDVAIDAAIAHVHTLLTPPVGTLAIVGRAVVRGGVAIVVGDAFGERIDSHARRLLAEGYELVPYSPVLVDPATGELLVYEGNEPVGGSYRRIPIAALVALAAAPLAGDPPVVQFAQLSALVAGRAEPTRAADVAGLLQLLQHVRLVRHDDLDSRSVVALIRSL